MGKKYRNASIMTEVPFSEQLRKVLDQVERKGVRLVGCDAISDYLTKSPDILELIPTAVEAVQTYLPDAQLFLRVYHDPEVEDMYLTLLVRLPEYDDAVIERIRKAEAMFIDALANRQGWLQITTDFR
jgi:hypothetical protein